MHFVVIQITKRELISQALSFLEFVFLQVDKIKWLATVAYFSANGNK